MIVERPRRDAQTTDTNNDIALLSQLIDENCEDCFLEALATATSSVIARNSSTPLHLIAPTSCAVNGLDVAAHLAVQSRRRQDAARRANSISKVDIEKLRALDRTTSVPAPPSAAIALGNFAPSTLPPSVKRTVLSLTDDQADATTIRLIKERTTAPAVICFETPDETRKLDQREREIRRGGFTVRNKRLRERACRIAKDAPSAACWRTAVHRTSTEITGSRVKCSSWGCLHCSKDKAEQVLTELVERFAERDRVCIIAFPNDAARVRFKDRITKRRQRTGLDLGAIVVPVAGESFLAFSQLSDAEGEMFSLVDAFEILVEALDARAELARLRGRNVDKRRISRPGLAPVRDSAKEEDSSLRSNADKAEERRPVGMIFREVSSADLVEIAVAHGGKRGGKARKGGWSYRFPTEADNDAFVADLERLYDLTTDEALAENRTHRSARLAWENEQAEAFA